MKADGEGVTMRRDSADEQGFGDEKRQNKNKTFI